MKNPSLAAAGLLGLIALAVGGFVLLTRGDDPAPVKVDVPVAAAAQPTFLNLSPREQRKKANLEKTMRELDRIKKTGEEVAPGEYKITDETGTTWYHGELIKGIGRNGEPLYMTASYKLRSPVPLRERHKLPAPKLSKKPPVHALDFGKGQAGGENRVKGATGSTGGDGNSGSGTGAGAGSGSNAGSGSTGGGGQVGPKGE